jgi:hypothetical protein
VVDLPLPPPKQATRHSLIALSLTLAPRPSSWRGAFFLSAWIAPRVFKAVQSGAGGLAALFTIITTHRHFRRIRVYARHRY